MEARSETNDTREEKEALAHRLQRCTTCKIQNDPKMADVVWKSVYPEVFGYSKQLLLNKFFDPSTPSMRKCPDGGKKGGKKKRLMKIMATTLFASSLSPE